jgi:integrase/recombinase XerD
MTADNTFEVHITPMTHLMPAIQSWKMFLEDQGKSVYTVKAFLGDMNLLASFLPPDQTIGSVTTDDLNHFLNWLQKGRGVSCSPKTLSRRITSIKSFFRWLNQNGAIIIDPAEKIVQKSVISPLPTVLTPEEQALLLETANAYRTQSKPDARPYVLLGLLLSTGIKKGECLNISLYHIDLEAEEEPILFIRYPGTSNRYKERKLPLTQDWISAYKEYLKQYKPLDQVFPWSPRRLEYLLEEIGEKAGLDKHVSFDMCRWTSALNDWQENIEPDKIRQKLGISKIQWREVKMKLKKLALPSSETPLV